MYSTDQQPDYSLGFSVYISEDNSSWTLCGLAPTKTNKDKTSVIRCLPTSGLRGRFLKMERSKSNAASVSKTLQNDNYLVLCEVVVWGHAAEYIQTSKKIYFYRNSNSHIIIILQI